MASKADVRAHIEKALTDAVVDSKPTILEDTSKIINNWLSEHVQDDKVFGPRVELLFRVLYCLEYFSPGTVYGNRSRANLNQMVRHFLFQGSDYGAWIESDASGAHIYESFLATLAARPLTDFAPDGSTELLPTVLLWSAFGPGNYGHADRKDWAGINPAAATGSRYWVYQQKAESRQSNNRVNSDTTYNSYVDHLYDRLGRLSDPIDVVFADLIMLNDLEERRMISPLRQYDSRMKSYYKAGHKIGRAGMLGRLATVNYHIPAVSKRLLDVPGPSATREAELDADIVAALAHLTRQQDGNAKHIFEYRAAADEQLRGQTRADDIQHSLSFPEAWKKEMMSGIDTADSRLSGKDLARRWFADFDGIEINTPDPFLVKLGNVSPVSPMQFAEGAHATYSCFAYFANCSRLVSGFVERADVDDENDEARTFLDPQSGRELNLDRDVKENPCVVHRGGAYLRMASSRLLVERCARLFNLIWHFSPALCLALDHVTAARARVSLYDNRWFDLCLPAEAVLFHSASWLKNVELRVTPAWLNGEDLPLSCFGGYAFAVSSEARFPESAHQLARRLLEGLDQTPADSEYRKVIPDGKHAAEIGRSAVRPPVPFWHSIDSTISETVRLYIAALLVLRALKADCTLATMGQLGSVPADYAGQLENGIKSVKKDFSLKAQRPALPTLPASYLFGELRGHIDAHSVRRILLEVHRRVETGWQDPQLSTEVLHSLSSLVVDADYISGIISSCRTLHELSENFIDTCVRKLAQIAASKNWILLQVKEPGE